MVTRLSSTVVDTIEESNYRYRPDLTSGLTVQFDDGTHVDFAENEIAEFQQFTSISFTLTDDATNYIVLNHDIYPSALVATTTLPDNPHILYTIVTVSGAVSSVTDWRWKVVSNRLLSPLPSNSLDAFLDANSWAYYPMRESSTAYACALSNGPNLVAASAGATAFGIPGLTRGAPRHGAVYSLAGNATQRTVIGAGGLAGNLWTEGGLACLFCVQHLSGAGADPHGLIEQTYVDTSNDYVRLEVEGNGQLHFRFQFGSHNIDVTSAVSAVTANEPHSCMIMQNADGNGPIMYLDGVDVTDTVSYGGSMGTDDWVSDGIAADSSTATADDLRIGHNWENESDRTIVSVPSIFDTGMNSTKAAEYHAAANLSGQTSDIYEFLLREFLDGEVAHFPNEPDGGGLTSQHLGFGTNEMQGSWIGTAQFAANTDMNSEYAGALGYDFDGLGGSNPAQRNTSVTSGTEMGPELTAATGTFLAIVQPTSDATGDDHQYIHQVGAHEASFNASYGGFNLWCEGDGAGNVSFHVMAHTNGAGTEWRIGDVGEYPINAIYRITVTQDGTGMSATVNGVSKTLNVEQTKGGTDITTQWIGEMVDDYLGAAHPFYIGSCSFQSGLAKDYNGKVYFIGYTKDGNDWDSTLIQELEDAFAGTGSYL